MSCWAQDNGIYILDNDFKPLIIENGLIRKSENGLLKSRADQLNFRYKKIRSRVDGGNAYFGIKENGERYLLVGENAVNDTALKLSLEHFGINLENILEASNGTLEFSYNKKNYQTSIRAILNGQVDSTIPLEIRNLISSAVNNLSQKGSQLRKSALQVIANDFELNEKQVKVVSSPEFHIDMFMRPIDEKTILVYDPDLTKEILAKEKEKVPADKQQVIQQLIDEITEFENQRVQVKKYAPMNTIIEELKTQGYDNIVRVPGIFTSGSTNFLNALVHKNTNGEYIYITNTGSQKQNVVNFNKIFEEELRKKCSLIKHFYFLGDIE